MAGEVVLVAEVRRRISQLANLADRYDIRERGREGQLLADVVEVLRELSLDIEEVQANQWELAQYVEEIDSDLLSLEEDIFTPDEDGFDEEDDEPSFSGKTRSEGINYIQLECPVCELESSFNEQLFHQDGIQLTCPHCGNVVFDSDEDYLVLEDDDEDEESPSLKSRR